MGPARAVAAVVGPPLAAEALIWATDAHGSVALALRVLGVAVAAVLVLRTVVVPARHALASARLAVEDLEGELVDERRAQDFRRRFEVAIAAADSEPAALRTGLRALAELLPDHDPVLLLNVPDEARVGWSVRLVGGELVPAEPVAGTPRCRALATGVTAVCATSHALDACAHLDSEAETSSVCLPLMVGDRLLGTICLTGAPGDVPAADRLATAEWVTQRTGARLDDHRSRHATRPGGRTDPLTGLHLGSTMKAQLRELVRSLTPFCAAVVDIDGSEAYRELNGDAEADDAVALLADVLKETLRPDDLICRLDDARFGVVLSRCTGTQAMAALERAREGLVLALAEEGGLHFTFSAGVVESHRATSLEEIVQLADAACAAARLDGGNRVLVSD